MAAELPSLDGPMPSYGGVHEYPDGRLAIFDGPAFLTPLDGDDGSMPCGRLNSAQGYSLWTCVGHLDPAHGGEGGRVP